MGSILPILPIFVVMPILPISKYCGNFFIFVSRVFQNYRFQHLKEVQFDFLLIHDGGIRLEWAETCFTQKPTKLDYLLSK